MQPPTDLTEEAKFNTNSQKMSRDGWRSSQHSFGSPQRVRQEPLLLNGAGHDGAGRPSSLLRGVCVCVVCGYEVLPSAARSGWDCAKAGSEVSPQQEELSGRAARRNRIFGRAEISWTETMMFFWTVWDERDRHVLWDRHTGYRCVLQTDGWRSDLWSHTLSSGVLICHTPIMHCKHEGQTHSITTQPDDSDWHHTHTHNTEHTITTLNTHTHTQYWTHNHNAEHTHRTLDTHTHTITTLNTNTHTHTQHWTHTITTLNTHTHHWTHIHTRSQHWTHTHTHRVRACVFGLCSSDALE